jgi:hypothetical protein
MLILLLGRKISLFGDGVPSRWRFDDIINEKGHFIGGRGQVLYCRICKSKIPNE